MTPLWLDLLRTPMAAPETLSLRRMRRIWQLLCLATAATIGCYGPLHAAFGQRVTLLAFGLLVSLAAVSWLYLSRKHAADSSFISSSTDLNSCFRVGNSDAASPLTEERR